MNTDLTTLELITFCKENNLDKNLVLQCLKEYQSTSLEAIKKSLENYDVTLSDIVNGNVLQKDGFFYHEENYVYCHDTHNILPIDESFFCDYDNIYIENETVRVYVGRRVEQWSEKYADRYAYFYDGDYYNREALDYHDLLIDCEGEVAPAEDVYYWERDGEYHHEPEDSDEYVNEYHSDSAIHEVNFSKNPQFFIGFEIEKEDQDVKESILIEDFKEECESWKKEKDGSLDDESGFELISPKFELDVQMIKKTIEENDILLEHINAKKSDACGGHINVSESGKSGSELFDEIKGYTPLFHALYYKRINKSHCKGKKNDDLKKSCEKYQSVKIHGNRVEYRIISAVPDFDTLIWRTKLFDFILKNKTSCVKEAFFKINSSPLKDLIKEMYPNNFEELIDRLVKYTLEFEEVNLMEK